MKIKLSTPLIIILALSFIALTIMISSRKKPTVAIPTILHLRIERLDQKLFNCTDVDALMGFLDKNPSITKKFFQLKDEDLRSTATRLYDVMHTREMQQLYKAVQTQYEDISAIENDLSFAFSFIKAQFPEFKAPKIFAMVTGMQLDYYIDSEIIIIGLDYFLGPESRHRPIGMVPTSLLHTYSKEYILPKMLFLLLKSLVKFDPNDKTILSQMMYYGRVLYLLKGALPKIEEHLIFDYTREELLEAIENQGFIWDFFVDKKLFYSINTLENAKYLEPRDSVLEIYHGCPKQIARWLGCAIVNSYMKENKVSIRQLVNTINAQAIFSKSKFKPYKYS